MGTLRLFDPKHKLRMILIHHGPRYPCRACEMAIMDGAFAWTC